MRLAMATILIMILISAASGLQSTGIVGKTGEPVLYDKGGAPVLRTFGEEEYQKILADREAKKSPVVSVKRKPDNLPTNPRYGYINQNGQDVSWIIAGDDGSGYTMYVDFNANGDLTDDRPLPFEKHDDKYSVILKTIGKSTDDQGQSYPVIRRLQIIQMQLSPKQPTTMALLSYVQTIRSGSIKVGDRDITFGVVGMEGLYDRDSSGILIDQNNDGQLDIETPKSSEFYKNKEKFVNIGDNTYEFKIDRYGNSLTLSRLSEKRPARSILTNGGDAPDFDFVDLDGKKHKLSDYRGKIVVIDFWGTWCYPCVAETPTLVKDYAKFHDQGFEILGVDSGDKEEVIRKFADTQKTSWLQTMEEEGGGLLHKLYRVDSWPSHYLIDKDGKIVLFSNNWAKIMEKVNPLTTQ